MEIKKFKYCLNEINQNNDDIQTFMNKVKVRAVHISKDGKDNLYINVHYERKRKEV